MSELTRRDWLALTLGATAALALDRRELFAQQRLITRAIPSSRRALPVIGLGSSATFSQVARRRTSPRCARCFKALVDGGGTVFDTAPGYGASEEVAGRIVSELGSPTRSSGPPRSTSRAAAAAGRSRGGAGADRDVVRARRRRPRSTSSRSTTWATSPTQLPILKELKQQGRIRYIGVTTTFERPVPAMLVATMRNEPLDFIGVDYAIDNREVEDDDPAARAGAQDRRASSTCRSAARACSIASATGRCPSGPRSSTRTTWAQFFLKFVVSHPAVTVVTPATSQAKNMIDNLGGGVGRLPDEAMRKRMVGLRRRAARRREVT